MENSAGDMVGYGCLCFPTAARHKYIGAICVIIDTFVN